MTGLLWRSSAPIASVVRPFFVGRPLLLQPSIPCFTSVQYATEQARLQHAVLRDLSPVIFKTMKIEVINFLIIIIIVTETVILKTQTEAKTQTKNHSCYTILKL